MRVKNAKNRLRSRSQKKDAPRETARPRIAAPALIGILTAAALVVVINVFQRSDSGIASVEAATGALPQIALPARSLDTTKAPPANVPTAAAARTRTPDTIATSGNVVESPRMTPVETTQHPDAMPHASDVRHANPRLPADSASIAKLSAPADPPPNASATVMNAGAVTISGCLQAGDASFWLTDTSGADAPKARSWKSGFLKKRGESIQIVAAAKALQLSSYVAQRVTATGTLANRTMQARSLERVAGSCH